MHKEGSVTEYRAKTVKMGLELYVKHAKATA